MKSRLKQLILFCTFFFITLLLIKCYNRTENFEGEDALIKDLEKEISYINHSLNNLLSKFKDTLKSRQISDSTIKTPSEDKQTEQETIEQKLLKLVPSAPKIM